VNKNVFVAKNSILKFKFKRLTELKNKNLKKKIKKLKNKKFNVKYAFKNKKLIFFSTIFISFSFDDLIIYANLIKLLESAFDFCFQKIKYYQN